MNIKTSHIFLSTIVALSALVAAGLLGTKLRAAIIAEEGPPAACFAMGDEGVTFHKWCKPGECAEKLYDAWIRCAGGNCYWQSSDGGWGVDEYDPRTPWMVDKAAELQKMIEGNSE